MRWHLSNRFDKRALRLADKHYSRQKPETNQFVAPGSCVVLLTEEADALWVSLFQKPEYTDHAWPGAWNSSMFHNESPWLSSDLILEGIAATLYAWGEPGPLGMITMVNPKKVRSTNLGYCYQMAGFKKVGWTKSGQCVLQLLPDEMPMAQAPIGFQELFAV